MYLYTITMVLPCYRLKIVDERKIRCTIIKLASGVDFI